MTAVFIRRLFKHKIVEPMTVAAICRVPVLLLRAAVYTSNMEGWVTGGIAITYGIIACRHRGNKEILGECRFRCWSLDMAFPYFGSEPYVEVTLPPSSLCLDILRSIAV